MNRPRLFPTFHADLIYVAFLKDIILNNIYFSLMKIYEIAFDKQVFLFF